MDATRDDMVFALTRWDMDLFCLRKTRLNVSVASGAIAEADNLSARRNVEFRLFHLGLFMFVAACLLFCKYFAREGATSVFRLARTEFQ